MRYLLESREFVFAKKVFVPRRAEFVVASVSSRMARTLTEPSSGCRNSWVHVRIELWLEEKLDSRAKAYGSVTAMVKPLAKKILLPKQRHSQSQKKKKNMPRIYFSFSVKQSVTLF